MTEASRRFWADKEAVNAVLRRGRHLLYRCLDPADRLFLRINGLAVYPPISLRRQVSRLGFVDGAGVEYCAYLRVLAALKPRGRLLDLGCGCGLLELALESSRWDGDVVGVDIHKPSIDWCVRTIGQRWPSCRFVHSDIYNAAYWRRGTRSAEEWLAHFEERDFDCIVAKSLFTHMLPEELHVYVADLATRLKSTGRALLTFFLLNDEQARLSEEGRSDISFIRPSPTSSHAVSRLDAPTAAVGHDEATLTSLLESHELELVGPVHYGSWSGRDAGLSYQDIVIVTRS